MVRDKLTPWAGWRVGRSQLPLWWSCFLVAVSVVAGALGSSSANFQFTLKLGHHGLIPWNYWWGTFYLSHNKARKNWKPYHWYSCRTLAMPTASRTSSPKPKPQKEELRQETVSLPKLNHAQWFERQFRFLLWFGWGGSHFLMNLVKRLCCSSLLWVLRNSLLTLLCRNHMMGHVDKGSSWQKKTRRLHIG